MLLQSLPTDLLPSIISHLLPSDLCSLESTSKKWKETMNGRTGIERWQTLTIEKILEREPNSNTVDKEMEDKKESDLSSSSSLFIIELKKRLHEDKYKIKFDIFGDDDDDISICSSEEEGEEDPKGHNNHDQQTNTPTLSQAKVAFQKTHPQPFFFPATTTSSSPMHLGVDVNVKNRTILLDHTENYDDDRAILSDVGFSCQPESYKLTPTSIPNQWILSNRIPYYFEVQVKEIPPRPSSSSPPPYGSVSPECLAIGLGHKSFPNFGAQPGWKSHSIGYHGDDGGLFVSSSLSGSNPFGPTFGKKVGDVVGCGLDGRRGEIFFTLGGKFVGVGAVGVVPEEGEDLHPILGVGTYSKLEVNFGTEPFVYDMGKYEEDRSEAMSMVMRDDENGLVRSRRVPPRVWNRAGRLGGLFNLILEAEGPDDRDLFRRMGLAMMEGAVAFRRLNRDDDVEALI